MKRRLMFFGTRFPTVFVLATFLTLIFPAAFSQYTVNKVVGKKNQGLRDSLEKEEYPYLLPIWGQKVTKKGFDLPNPVGVNLNYLTQKSDIIISDLQVGFNNGPLYNLDEIVRIDEAKTTTNGINFRPDFWIFPFLNVYGILAQSNTSTAIKAGVWIPDSSSWHKILDINTKANFHGTTYGFGFTPTMGIAGFFFALDMNFTWTDIDQLDKPAYAFVLGPRLGRNFRFKNPSRSLAVWVGGFRIQLNNSTAGSLSTSSLFPTDQWQSKIDTGYIKVSSAQDQVNAWWNGLTPPEQKNPINVAKYNTANAALGRAGQILDAASQVVTNASESTIQYSLNKRPKDAWNFIIGSQFQLDKRFMIRAEYGFLGTRTQFIGGLQYRFGF
jgi:hypothetical protein